MEFGLRKSRDTNPLIIATLALVVLGMGISYVTWHNLKQQRETINEHMFLSSQVILRGIETSLLREVRGHQVMGHGMMHGRAEIEKRKASIRTQIVELLTDLVNQSEVDFLSLYTQDGKLILTVADKGLEYPEIPAYGWEALQKTGEWQAFYSKNKQNIFVAGLRSKRSLGQIATIDSSLPPPPGGMGTPYLVVGLDASRHLDQFGKFRSTAMYQTLYVLLVAVFLWGLAIAYMRRRDMGKRLHRLERFHSRLLDTMPEGLLTLDKDGLILAANPASEAILRQNREGTLIGRFWQKLPLKSVPQEELQGHFPVGTSERTWVQYDYDGRCLEVLMLPIPPSEKNPDEDGERLVLVRDRTDIKALEDDLAEVRQLAAIGRLAASLAHEIRNPLSALRGFAQLFAEKLKGRQPEQQYAEIMVREADRLNKVVSDLLFLSRPRRPELMPVDMRMLCADIQNLTARDFELKGAELHMELSPDLALSADMDMLKQALLNLVINSLNALPEPDDSEQDEQGDGPEKRAGKVEILTEQRENAVMVAVRDNGHGMSEDDRAHALEAFFTSRKEGTGLGLAIVHRIMRAHGGQVSILSHTGEPSGTEVQLIFPVRVQNNESRDGVDENA
ncbi:two-component system sensor histidine kinase NtrB [Desulfobaculum bizertense]|uniref:histidine kinase n=1 Tax=Desulfobaculum bizertense DSM 18034 TaxID=1121442 RepID=A0A1T4VF28_9BACT|nr:ATP-binding protein [Desulfobaculum bizertense]UIJ37706.1 ATP-binding protein [Desulfobaculum bizertense]SKA63560.1 two-component system, NtrC family, sensor histidine kinase HydH [Desulfobaculum bizertense DSM 18034]